jgi:hypothetical protein
MWKIYSDPIPTIFQNVNRPLADVVVVFIQEITRGWDAFHPARRNLRLHGCFLSIFFLSIHLLKKIIDGHPPSGHGRFGVGDVSPTEDDGVLRIAGLVGFNHVLTQ